MSIERVHVGSLEGLAEGSLFPLDGEESHHLARVRRAQAGDAVRAHDGRGRIAHAVIDRVEKGKDGWIVWLRVAQVEVCPPSTPRVEVWAPAPKGDRLSAMIEGLAQVGAAAWIPLICQRAVVEPRETKMDRLRRIAEEATKQCGRAWTLEIGEPASLARAFEDGVPVVLADAHGQGLATIDGPIVRLLIGPEGGLTPEELAEVRSRGGRASCFGPHIMRIETAAVVAAASLLQGASPQR